MPHPPRLPGLSIVLPCFNEADNVGSAIAQADAAAARCSDRFEVIVVDDGSTDATGEIAAGVAAARPSVRLIVHRANLGYGAAVRSGIRAARMPYLLLTDGDLQFDLMQLEELLPLVGSADLIVGYRAVRMDSLPRRLDGALWNRLVRIAFGLRMRDVDCAFKLVPRQLVADLPLTSEGATISTELMVKCVRAGATFREVPVRHRPRTAGHPSGADAHVILRAFRELAVLRTRVSNPGSTTTPS